MKRALLTLSLFGAILAANAQTNGKTTTAPTNGTQQTTTNTTTPVNPNGPSFKFEKEEYSFGSVKQGDMVNYDFNFTNTGKEPLIITEAHGSCGCTVPNYPKEPIKPGEKAVIKVTFNSAGKSGMQDKTVTITSNAKEGQKVLHLKGNVEVKPVEETFPTKKEGEGTPVEKHN
jgi:hypothetical protein